MTPKMRIEIKLSENRQAINELLEKGDDLTTEDRAELEKLSKANQGLETEYRAAVIAEKDWQVTAASQFDDPENREFRALVDNADLGNVFNAVMEHRAVDGREKELQDHFKLAGNVIPLAMLEVRAITPAPADVGQNQAAIIPAIFPQSAAAFMGVDMPTVGVGESVYPVMTSHHAAGDVDESASVDETTGAFTADVLKPRRIQASFFYSREDRARFAGMDAALRQNLSDALSNGLDKIVIAKTDSGLIDFGTDPTAPGTKSGFADYRDSIFDAIDGRYASTTGEIRLLVGAGTYKAMGAAYRGNNADDSALDSVMRISGGVKVSAHIPDASSNVQQAVTARALNARHAVCPIWEGIQLIPDEITKAKTGEIVLTAIMMHAFKIIRADGFKRVSFKLA